MSLLGERLLRVRARIDEAARDAKRDPNEITLVAVSKKHSVESIREAHALGQRAFGESYAQELAEKAAALTDLDIQWHFIGHLQRNKAKFVAQFAHVVHALDSAEIAHALGTQLAARHRTARALIAIRTDLSKSSGALPADLPAIMDAIRAASALQLAGLMTLPPPDLAETERAFESLRALQMANGGPAVLPELSIGMSADLEIAIRHGATLVRVGTDIFGEREPTR